MMYLRSIIFNVLFYGLWTPLICIGLLPALALPRKGALWVARLYQNGAYVLQKYLLGLDYELRGLENRPPPGQACLVAAKHFSAYETLHLYRLFDDPAVILKKELLKMPLFGWFLKKLDVIALDRARGAIARQSLLDGAALVVAQHRPIVIFPQGTRVALSANLAEKPYKSGLIKLYAATHLPIYPVALNTGLYWPRNSFWKKSGTIVIEFLPRIEPGLDPETVARAVETAIETASAKLIAEGRARMNAP